MNLCVMCIMFMFVSNVIAVSSVENAMKCLKNSDCSRSKTCLQGYCKSPCMEICGPRALCAVMNHKPYCFCRDESEDCIPRKVLRKCLPECEKNSVCNTDIGFCECKTGYHGNPYRGCLKKCTTFDHCSSNEICSGGSCKSPCLEDCGVNALCAVVNQTSICSCPAGYTGNSLEICRPIAESLFSTENEICTQCEENAQCLTVDDITRCICPRGYIGNPYKSCNKMCLVNSDCSADKICTSHFCTDPCLEVCGVNAKCVVELGSRKPKCTCKEGFSGDPSRICTISLSARSANPEDELKCHPTCGTNASCNTKYGICTCNIGYIGNPYGHCRKKCASHSDCLLTSACDDGDCKDPCLYACGKNAICHVERHKAKCRCPYGFSGDALKICKPAVTTQTSIIGVDLCDLVKCGAHASCQTSGQETCKCLPGFHGNPYTECSKTCQVDSDCSDDEACKNGTCRKACIDSCGLNARCQSKGHLPSCRCPDNYIGDPSRICFPNAKGVLVNPSRVPCLKCICRAITGNDDIFACAEKSINLGYWAFAGEDLVGGENFRTRNSTMDFLTCMNDKICIFNTMNDYTSRALHRLSDIDCDGDITCADYFSVHKFGLTAKFNDSIFDTSEARSFDQCEDHGTKDVTDNWTPNKCSGPSYVDLLS